MKAKACAAVGASSILLLAALPAHATSDGQLTLLLDGVESGWVRSSSNNGGGDGSKKTLTITTDQPTRPLLNTVRTFLDGNGGKGLKKSTVVLSTGAVIQKANDARLVDVRMPSYAGGSNDLALTFEAPSTSTSPSLRTASDRAKPTGIKLAGFRLSMGDLPTNEATRLDAISIKNREGSAVPGAFVFDVPSSTAPAFQSWSKKSVATPRDGSIEYVSPTGDVILGVKLASCTPSSVKIDGPVTHIAITCARAHGI